MLDFLLHFDEHLQTLAAQHGPLIYLLLFAIIFAETGLVLTPFLPGDSVLFTAGALAAGDALHLGPLLLLLFLAAATGDTVNYAVGQALGRRAFTGKIPFLQQHALMLTQQFYEKQGSKIIILARFIPLVRTFAPFVAGIGRMAYARFLVYNVVGGAAWVLLFTLLGYFLGHLPFVRSHFEWLVVAIIGLSVLPALRAIVKQRTARQDSHTRR